MAQLKLSKVVLKVVKSSREMSGLEKCRIFIILYEIVGYMGRRTREVQGRIEQNRKQQQARSKPVQCRTGENKAAESKSLGSTRE